MLWGIGQQEIEPKVWITHLTDGYYLCLAPDWAGITPIRPTAVKVRFQNQQRGRCMLRFSVAHSTVDIRLARLIAKIQRRQADSLGNCNQVSDGYVASAEYVQHSVLGHTRGVRYFG